MSPRLLESLLTWRSTTTGKQKLDMLAAGCVTLTAAALLLLHAFVQPALSKTQFQSQAEAVGLVPETPPTEPDYACSKTKPCKIGCCGPL
jgi:hypothetical protein